MRSSTVPFIRRWPLRPDEVHVLRDQLKDLSLARGVGPQTIHEFLYRAASFADPRQVTHESGVMLRGALLLQEGPRRKSRGAGRGAQMGLEAVQRTAEFGNGLQKSLDVRGHNRSSGAGRTACPAKHSTD